ncbi:hypothetical protein J4220_01410 [Candidatus Micrarchaeota archaeon]|nr:hypothetical protein [Candidatus Micrarchaeota archaeon]
MKKRYEKAKQGMAGFIDILSHAVEAYSKNSKLIVSFSIPLLIAFPLSLLLPNFVALSGTFLRLGSVKLDLSAADVLVTLVALLLSLVFFAFAIAAINVTVKSQRTLNRLTSRDVELIEGATFSLFFIFLTAFAAIVGFNLLIAEYGIPQIWATVFALIVSSIVLFAPQAVVLEEAGLSHAVAKSVSLIQKKFGYFILFLIVAGLLFLANTWVFIEISKGWPAARFLSLVTQSLIVLPFLEVLKVQIYLSKYSLLN